MCHTPFAGYGGAAAEVAVARNLEENALGALRQEVRALLVRWCLFKAKGFVSDLVLEVVVADVDVLRSLGGAACVRNVDGAFVFDFEGDGGAIRIVGGDFGMVRCGLIRLVVNEEGRLGVEERDVPGSEQLCDPGQCAGGDVRRNVLSLGA